jgi:hypothetical protein
MTTHHCHEWALAQAKAARLGGRPGSAAGWLWQARYYRELQASLPGARRRLLGLYLNTLPLVMGGRAQ